MSADAAPVLLALLIARHLPAALDFRAPRVICRPTNQLTLRSPKNVERVSKGSILNSHGARLLCLQPVLAEHYSQDLTDAGDMAPADVAGFQRIPGFHNVALAQRATNSFL